MLTKEQEDNVKVALDMKKRDYWAKKGQPQAARTVHVLKCQHCGGMGGDPGVTIGTDYAGNPIHRNCPKGPRGVLP